jgi:hypothetical protein
VGPQASDPLVESHDPPLPLPESRIKFQLLAVRFPPTPEATNQPFPLHAARARRLLLAIVSEGAAGSPSLRLRAPAALSPGIISSLVPTRGCLNFDGGWTGSLERRWPMWNLKRLSPLLFSPPKDNRGSRGFSVRKRRRFFRSKNGGFGGGLLLFRVVLGMAG